MIYTWSANLQRNEYIMYIYISTVKEIAKKTINYKDISAKNSYSNSRTFVMSARIIVALF